MSEVTELYGGALTVRKTRRFKELEDGVFLTKFLRAFGEEFLQEWDKKSISSDYWRIGVHQRTVKPIAGKLTERTTRLRNSMKKDGDGGIREIKVTGNSLTISKGSNVPYSHYQEFLKGGQRSYLASSLNRTLFKLNLIVKRALRKI